ncbi:hypothetical protein NML43_09845 [Rhodopseudomonas palustris]|uniref:hypothetical protein n=1 Tax=Rhodopseudomonas palustris TaxID=1076 RepID=UPI0020CF8C53|nr:hypothetical protein [Rhodopseudomonas palustris]MCP9627388.1 hypothetical protein [Rhodopseudomonas palustris]
MEYLSAIGPLLILIFFGGGLVIVAYLAFDDMRTRGLSWSGGSFSATVTSMTERLKGLPAGPAIVGAAIVLGALVVYVAAGSMERAPVATATVEDSAPPAEATPAPAAIAATPAAEKPVVAPAAPSPAANNAMASMATPGAVRTVTSSSCASNGCPVSCGADEVLASAYCISGGAARLTDQLQVKDGVVTARCSPGASSISVACARK